MRTSLVFSGTESEMHHKIASKYADRLMMSYYYCRDKGDILEKRIAAKPSLQYWLDSGAHTLQKGGDNEVDWTLAQWEKYVASYCEWLLQHADSVYAAAELDVGNMIPPDIVYGWRDKYFRPLEKQGLQIIYVYHDWDGPQMWESMCRTMRYIGISYGAVKNKSLGRRMTAARRFRTRVHGFAITNYRSIREGFLYTADSTSWKSGEKYGQWYLWTNKIGRAHV